MPQVPHYQPGQVAGVQPNEARFRAFDNGGGALGGLATGARQLGQEVSQYATAQDQINALNDDTQARKMAMDAHSQFTAITSPYTQTEGGTARAQQGGTLEALGKARDSLLETATNPRMRRLAEERIGTLYADSAEQINNHALQQTKVERGGALVGQQKMLSDGAISTPDPDKRLALIGQMQGATNDLLDFHGVTDPMARAYALRTATSNVHRSVIENMLSSSDPDIDMVQAYRAAHHDDMTPEDNRAISQAIQQPLQMRQADHDFQAAVGHMVPEAADVVAPGIGGGGTGGVAGQMTAITAKSESGNRDRDESGKLITSPKGAMGSMQVMPATARNPGFGIKPWDGKSDDDLRRVGMQVQTAMLQKYRDPAKAWAAYNWGTGHLDRAIEKYGDGWFQHAPDETKAYVTKNMAALGSVDQGQGGASAGDFSTDRPQDWDKSKVYGLIEGMADSQGWSFERTERAKRRADQVIGKADDLRERQEKAAANSAVLSIVAMGADNFTSMNQLPRAVREGLSPSMLMSLTDKAKDNAQRATAIPENTADALRLEILKRRDPDAFMSANLAEVVGKVSGNQLKSLVLDQQTMIGEKSRKDAAFDPTTGIDSAITRARRLQGIKVEDGDYPAVYDTMKGRIGQIIARQGSATAKDYDQAFKDAVRDVPMQRTIFGFSAGRTSTKAFQLDLGTISPAHRQAIEDTFQRVNHRKPTDDEVLSVYRAQGAGGQ
ncbi:transglycosylase SLT domain-containing protein [Novosphingobium rosa]|uniref:transglycosylase SLT domain-containing protein n=1 Tax=Novosphingobium rosa TaxID=76978 RepID=UPI00082A5CE1|nr:transglycosylase SLT domain-containing protein [Novosphingobium rosa]